MAEMKCFNVAFLVINEATKQFSPLWEIDNEKLDVLKQYCTVIDSIVKEFGGSELTVDVDDIKLTVSVEVVCDDITIQENNHSFYDLVERAISVSFKQSDDEGVAVKFVFPSVWNRVI